MKKLTALLICILLTAALLPATALADVATPTDTGGITLAQADNPAGTTLPELPAGATMTNNRGTITTNNGRVSSNYGTVSSNYGTVGTNTNAGVIDHNFGTVQTNDGRVDNYGGTVTTNNGFVNEFRAVTVTGTGAGHVVTTGLTDANGQKWISDGAGTAEFSTGAGYAFASPPTATEGAFISFGGGAYRLSGVTDSTTVTVNVVAAADYTMDFSMDMPIDWTGASINFSTTDADGAGWSWKYATKTLTLDGLTFTTTDAIAMKLPDGATIVTNGANTLTSLYRDGVVNTSYGIDCTGALTVSRGGYGSTLTATGGVGVVSSVGVHTTGNLTVDDARLTGIGGQTRQSYGVNVGGELVVDRGDLTASADGTGHCLGIYVAGSNNRQAIYIDSATVTATAGAGGGATSAIGIHLANGGIVNISGFVTGTAGSAAANSIGVYADGGANADIDVRQTGAWLRGTAGDSANGSSYGIYANGDIEQTATHGPTAGASGSAPNGDSYGIYAEKSINIAEGTFTGESGSADADGTSAGIFAGQGLLVRAGHNNLNVTGKAPADAGVGVLVGEGGHTVTVEGGTFTAQGSWPVAQLNVAGAVTPGSVALGSGISAKLGFSYAGPGTISYTSGAPITNDTHYFRAGAAAQPLPAYNPATGDAANIALYVYVAITAMGAIIVVLRKLNAPH